MPTRKPVLRTWTDHMRYGIQCIQRKELDSPTYTRDQPLLKRIRKALRYLEDRRKRSTLPTKNGVTHDNACEADHTT